MNSEEILQKAQEILKEKEKLNIKDEEILLKAKEILKKRQLLWECKRCGHIWLGRSIGKPAVCPRCHSKDWDNPKKKEIWKCYRCGYEWVAKVKEPRCCPSCGKREITRLEDYKKQIRTD